jgi:hypothetical protein
MGFWKNFKADLQTLTKWLGSTSTWAVEPEKKKVDLKDLQKKTKKELEKIGRKVGIELDRRLTKDKLIKQLKKASK